MVIQGPWVISAFYAHTRSVNGIGQICQVGSSQRRCWCHLIHIDRTMIGSHLFSIMHQVSLFKCDTYASLKYRCKHENPDKPNVYSVAMTRALTCIQSSAMSSTKKLGQVGKRCAARIRLFSDIYSRIKTVTYLSLLRYNGQMHVVVLASIPLRAWCQTGYTESNLYVGTVLLPLLVLHTDFLSLSI